MKTKTIEDVAKEFAEQGVWQCPVSFKAGIKYAQRWISVEDELPKEQGYYLVIEKPTFPHNCNVVVAEFDENDKTFYYERVGLQIEYVTHWRPIELK